MPAFSEAAFIASASPWSRVVGHSIRSKPASFAIWNRSGIDAVRGSMLYSTAVAMGSRSAARSLAAVMAKEERRSVRRCMSLLYRTRVASVKELEGN